MTGYFSEAGVEVADELTPAPEPPPGPEEAAAIGARWSVEFWTGPTDRPPLPD